MVLSNGFFYERIQLDTINERFNKVPTAKEGDANGRGMIVVLTENGIVKNTTGVSLLFKWEHTRIAGAQGLEDFEPLDLTKGEYIVTYPTEMNHEGYVKAEIRIIDNGKYAGSRNMKIQVEPSVGDDTAMESSNQFSALVTALLQVNSWNTTIDGKIVEWEADMEATKQLYIDTMNDVDAIYPTRLVSVEQQLAETLNKSAITLTHMFADNTARDAYFVAHPAELIELQFIKVGTTYQQYIEGVWTDSVPIVSEQLSATNQPIVDTGEYFVAENTNEALQELGAHKASTENPHGVTKAQVGLGNVDNTSDANKPVSTAVQTALNLKANKVQEEWITPTLLNGFTGKLMYRINQFNNLEIIGSLSYPSNLGTNTLHSFQLPMSHVPTWFNPSADFSDLRFKFTLNTDFTENVMARGTLSGFNGYFVIIHGGNRNRWHINMSIPMNM